MGRQNCAHTSGFPKNCDLVSRAVFVGKPFYTTLIDRSTALQSFVSPPMEM